jgi:carbonic anhydrase
MATVQHLLERNRAWSNAVRARNPDFFGALANQQAPRYLWIGCSDSRVPAN